MSTCGTRCSNISPALFSKPVFSEPQWKCGLPAVDFTGWLNAAAFWECPWSWKSFWEIPTNQQGQFPDLFICFLLRLSYNAPTAKRWIYKKKQKQKVSSFLKLRSSFPSCFQLDSVGNGLGQCECAASSHFNRSHIQHTTFFLFLWMNSRGVHVRRSEKMLSVN